MKTISTNEKEGVFGVPLHSYHRAVRINNNKGGLKGASRGVRAFQKQQAFRSEVAHNINVHAVNRLLDSYCFITCVCRRQALTEINAQCEDSANQTAERKEKIKKH